MAKNLGYKTYGELNSDDTYSYKIYCIDNYKINGNVARLNAINNFTDGFLLKPDLRITAPKSVQLNKPVLNELEIKRYINNAYTPLENLIVIYQLDGFLRPGEFSKLKISHHDIENQKLYLDETKSGDKSVILTPRMIEAYKKYLKYRIKPKYQVHSYYLIIIDKGTHYGLPITTNRSDLIGRYIKKIAVKGGFTKKIYSYLIKSSAITNGFNKQINPKILQRQARHKNIEKT